MAVMIHSWLFLFFFIHCCSCNQNIETSYPFWPPLSSPPPNNPPPNGTLFPPLQPPIPGVSPPPGPKSSSHRTVVKAVAATAASTFVVASLLFFFIRRWLIVRRRKEGRVDDNPFRGGSVVLNDNFERSNGGFRGIVVDEDGLDVHYWRKLEEQIVKNSSLGKKKSFRKVSRSPEDDEQDLVVHGKVQEVPLLLGKSSNSQNKVEAETSLQHGRSYNSQRKVRTQSVGEVSLTSFPSDSSIEFAPPAPLPPRNPQSLMEVPKEQAPPPPPPPPQNSAAIPHMQHGKSYNSQRKVRTQSFGEVSLTSLPSDSSIESAPPVPLPPRNPQSLMEVPKKQAPPPPPPPPQNYAAIPQKAGPSAPPPPPLKKSSAPPPPPLPLRKSSGSSGSSKLPPVNEGMSAGIGNGKAADENDTAAAGNGQVKLKPLHWDKVNKNTEHSMVWDKIDGGSFRFDDDLMEALFGTVATKRKSPRGKSSLSVSNDSNQGQSSQIFILDARKSQNIAIVLKSLGISRRGLVDALTDGEDINADILEKLMRIAPTKEEQTQILEFNGDPTSLADAESFLFHLLKDVPAAFTRLDAMLFRSNYDAEVLQLKELLQTLELGCKELRNRGLFMKLLEAILKAGNRMNAGTTRGNAQAFKLSSLGKLSDVKSTDGKTTLLHFVVEEVVRAEGKRCVLNRNRSLTRSSSISSNGSSTVSENSASKEEREKEYKKLGLPIVGGLSSEFTNVKKAAQIDYESFARTCSDLVARASQVRTSLSQCGSSKESNFARVMKDFLESVDQELAALKQEQVRIMENVKKTTEYYQPGAFNDKETNPLQLFVIIKEFLGLVDQVCVEIARNLQRRKSSTSSVGSSTKSPARKVPVRFPNLPDHFMKERSMSNSSESGGDF